MKSVNRVVKIYPIFQVLTFHFSEVDDPLDAHCDIELKCSKRFVFKSNLC